MRSEGREREREREKEREWCSARLRAGQWLLSCCFWLCGRIGTEQELLNPGDLVPYAANDDSAPKVSLEESEVHVEEGMTLMFSFAISFLQ